VGSQFLWLILEKISNKIVLSVLALLDILTGTPKELPAVWAEFVATDPWHNTLSWAEAGSICLRTSIFIIINPSKHGLSLDPKIYFCLRVSPEYKLVLNYLL
jgi:hypothetical protein